MQKFTFNRLATGQFSDQQLKLSENQTELLSFIGQTFKKENFRKQIQEKKKNFSAEKRLKLVSVLKQNYAIVEHSLPVQKNIELLALENTFTVTTGHQLSIFTGPVYLIYKIIHTIRLAEELKKEYPEYNFVPVYWMASEDHDFKEISSVEIFNKKLEWFTEQKGPVGRFDPEGLKVLKAEVLTFFENQPESEVAQLLEAYSGESLSEANFKLINELFNIYGLIILEGDDPELKKEFIPVIEKELKEQFSLKAVEKTNVNIAREGLKIQVKAREYNLFYIHDQLRERILPMEQDYFIEEVGKINSQQLLFELYEYPERFSPNVILRPVYQETILPNLCYLGGVGEISYWLQLKGVFDAIDLPYPIIQPRVSMLWIDNVMTKKLNRVSLVLEDLFKEISIVKKKYLNEFASEEVDFDELDTEVEKLKFLLTDKINCTDDHLEKYAQAEMVKLDKQIESIKEKLVKVVKHRHESAMTTIDQIFERLFPNNGLQERSLNLFSLCPDGKMSERISQLHNYIDPFDPDFIIIRE